MEISQDCHFLCLKRNMCSLQFGYSVICLVSSGFGRVIELLLASPNRGSECHWQDDFAVKAERNLPKLNLLLAKHWKISESIFLRLMEASGDTVWLLSFGFSPESCALSEPGPCCAERQDKELQGCVIK